MSWRPAGKSVTGGLIRFLRIGEWKHVNLSARIRSAGEKPRFGQVADGRLWVNDDGRRITGALFISRYGVVLPAYNPETATDDDREFLRRLILPRRDRIFSIIGTSDRVDDLEERAADSPVDSENYRMLTGNRLPEHESPEMSGLTFHRAAARDIDKLWPLEKAYQLEEVLREKSVLNESAGRRHFSTTLKEQMVFYAALDGRPVAKAGTNARGWYWDQVGGVFVTPDQRRRGLGRLIVRRLMEAIAEAGKSPCLFVKESNPAAMTLYRNLGFEDRGPFRITYWSH